MSPTDCGPLQLITVKGLWLQAPSLVPLFLYLSIWKFLSADSVLASRTDKIVDSLSVRWFQPSPTPVPRRDPPKKICVTSAPEYLVWMWGLSFSPHIKCHELVPRLDLTIAALQCDTVLWLHAPLGMTSQGEVAVHATAPQGEWNYVWYPQAFCCS